MKMFSKYALFLIAVFFCYGAQAFKIDTHLWVGQQVLNDLEDDGVLTVTLDNVPVNLVIPTDVKNAIIANKAAYLMGNIGPDAVPDVLVGQTVVHPGVEDANFVNIGWRTNKWLEHLLNISKNDPVGKAFAYGYLGHAAADVFAHTYVNQYAGDIFRLTDGETLVEQRHMILESFIAKYTPPLKDWRGNPIDPAWKSVISSAPYTDFVRKNLIYDIQVQSEYKKVQTATHLVAYTDFRNGIDALAKNKIWHDIDVAVLQIVAAYFDIQLSQDEASSIVNAAQPVINKLNVEIPDGVQAATNQLYSVVNKYDSKVFGTLSSAVVTMHSAEASWLSKHQEWRRKLTELKPLPSCPKIPVPYTECDWLTGCHHGYEMKDDPVCKATVKAIRQSNDLILDVADGLENEALDKKEDLIDSTIKVRDEAIKAANSVRQIQNSMIDLAQVFSARVSPIQSYLESWRGDVDRALNAYVTATSQSMLNTMDPNLSAIDPITTWFECYNKAIMGIPSSISGCQFKNSVTELRSSIEQILLLIEQATSVGSSVGIPGPLELRKLRDEYIAQLENDVKQRVGAEFKRFLPDEIKDILSLLDGEVSDASLNKFFTKADSSPKKLIMISDMAERVKGEMYLGSSTTFDPNRYAVAYNSVVLAKLALFDWVNIEALANSGGASDHMPYRYYLNNLVAQAFGSIDGNHQWMPVPPPYPNSTNMYSIVNYTYSTDRSGICMGCPDNGLGFVLWNGDMRNKLFRRLFKGPISPGIDAPEIINKPKIPAMSSHPYKVCSANPFPSDINDNSCVIIPLIPVLYGLLN